MIEVRLTPWECVQAAMGGVGRRVTNMGKGVLDRRIGNVDVWSMDIEGAAAEMALAKYMGRFWSPVSSLANGDATMAQLRAGDVGHGIQVKWTRHERGHLIVTLHDKTPADSVFVLVVGEIPLFKLVGWIHRGDIGPQHKRPTGWWVPQTDLHGMDSFKEAGKCVG